MKTKSILAGLLMAATSLWNAQSWQLIGDQADMSGATYSIAVSKINNMIYNAGYIKYGALTANQVFKWNFVEWAPVGNFGVTSTEYVKKIILDNSDKIYTMGELKDATGKYYIRYWDGSSWAPLGNLRSTLPFRDIATDGTNIYVAGTFVNTANGENCYVTKWNGTQWNVMPESNFNGIINAIAIDSQNNVYVAGAAKNALNQVGVFKIGNGTAVEVGKLRATSPVTALFINKYNDRIISLSEKTADYDPTTNIWTTLQTCGVITDYEQGSNFLSYGGSGSFYNFYAGNVLSNTCSMLSAFPINTGQQYSIKFDKFGYPVYGDNTGKVYRWSQKIGSGLATSETIAKSKITIYPNPSTGIVNISNKEKISSVEVYDAAGKLLQKAQPNTDKTQIDLSGKKGVYMIKATSNSGSDAQKVIIK